MEQSLIDTINAACPPDQGIFIQPFGIPISIKEPVIYSRCEIGGWTGKTCYRAAYAYEKELPDNNMEVLDIALSFLMPVLTFGQHRQIEKLVHVVRKWDKELYGNVTDYHIEYVIVSQLEGLLEQFKLED